MSKFVPDDLDRVKSSLELEENSDFRERVFGTFLENPESAANMIVEFASSKCSVSTDVNSVISYIESCDGYDESDIKLTPELLAGVGGGNKKFVREQGNKIKNGGTGRY